MNYLQIEAFMKIVEVGSMTKAADALFVSQSTLSDRINKLENDLNVELFSRGHGPRGLTLTEKGMSFIEVAKKYLSMMDDLEDWKTNEDYRTNIFISGPHSINSFLLPEFYKKYTDSEIKLNVSSHWNHNIYNMLDTYELDVGVVSRPYGSKHIKTTEFFQERLIITYNPDYSDYSNIEDASELNKSDEIHLDWGPDYEIWYQKYWNMSKMPKITVDSAELLAELLQTENAWAVMPLCIYSYMNRCKHNIKIIENIEKFYRTIYLVTQRNVKENVQHLITDLTEFLKNAEEKDLVRLILK
ncbi:MAG: LysR family transcriptional regulator [Tissierellia bacterium]|nr:LysR family transcriptional regulator [Tissierellia bacterium]